MLCNNIKVYLIIQAGFILWQEQFCGMVFLYKKNRSTSHQSAKIALGRINHMRDAATHASGTLRACMGETERSGEPHIPANDSYRPFSLFPLPQPHQKKGKYLIYDSDK